MQPSKRIVVNTLAQYVRTIINMVLSLYSSRLVLNILGIDDYGIYSLVAGVVSMLFFLELILSFGNRKWLAVFRGHLKIGMVVLVTLIAVVTLFFLMKYR